MWAAVFLFLWQPHPAEKAKLRVFDGSSGELLCEIETPLLEEKGNGTILLQAPHATLYSRDRNGNLRKGVVRAERGTYDRGRRCLTLRGRVRLEMAGGETLRTEDARIDFEAQHLETDGPFLLGKPGFEALGTGLRTRLDLLEGRIEREGRVHLFGDPGHALAGGEEKDSDVPRRSTLYSAGPMHFRETEKGQRVRISLAATREATFLREAAKGLITVEADRAELTATRPKGRVEPVLEEVRLRGHVRLRDSQGARAEAEKVALDEQRTLLRSAKFSRLSLGNSSLRAPEIEVDRREGILTGRGGASATLEEDGARIRGDVVKLGLSKAFEVTFVEAANRVEVRRGGLHILGRRFRWDPSTQRGTVLGAPMAEAARGGVRVRAPILAVQASVLAAEGPGKRLESTQHGKVFVARSRGIMQLSEDRIRLQGNASVRGPDFSVHGQSIVLRKGSDGEWSSIFVEGDARFWGTRADGGKIEGFARRIVLRDETLDARGGPSTLRTPRGTLRAHHIVLDRRTRSITAEGRGSPVLYSGSR